MEEERKIKVPTTGTYDFPNLILGGEGKYVMPDDSHQQRAGCNGMGDYLGRVDSVAKPTIWCCNQVNDYTGMGAVATWCGVSVRMAKVFVVLQCVQHGEPKLWYNIAVMEHRHINPGSLLTATAIDDIIDRGGRADWAFLRDRSREDSTVMAKIRRVCAAHLSDSCDQKYHLWELYARQATA